MGSEEGVSGSEMGLDLDEGLYLSLDVREERMLGFGFGGGGFRFGAGRRFGFVGGGCGGNEGLVCLGGVAEM